MSYLYFLVYIVVTLSVFIFKDFFFLWVLMELQIISFISLGFDARDYSSYGLSSYFLTQSLCSLIIVFFYYSLDLFLAKELLLLAFMFKLGVFPFVNWYVKALSEFRGFLLRVALTAQKLPSFILFFNVLSLTWDISIVIFIILLMVLNIFYCSFMSLSCISDLITFVWLSIARTFWVVLSGFISVNFFVVYYFVYCLFVCFFLYGLLLKRNTLIIISLLNLSGLPIFPDFFLKAYIISITFRIFISYSLFLPLVIMSLLFNVVYILSFITIFMKSLLNRFVSNI